MKTSLAEVWSRSATLFIPVLKRAWGWCLFSMIIEEAFTYWVGAMSKTDERLYFMGAVFALILQLLLSAIGIVIINQMVYDVMNKTKSGVIESLGRNLKYVFIETTRALLPILLKTLLFVVPGIIEGIRLYFVAYVAQFDKVYKEGKIDALQKSRGLVKNHMGAVTRILILALVLSIVPRLYLESVDLLTRPAYYVLIFAACLSTELYGDIALFSTYIRLEELHGDSVSLS